MGRRARRARRQAVGKFSDTPIPLRPARPGISGAINAIMAIELFSKGNPDSWIQGSTKEGGFTNVKDKPCASHRKGLGGEGDRLHLRFESRQYKK